jgi:hypothetical protein
MSTQWYKLKDETWGVKIRFEGEPGEEILVTNKSGDTKTRWLVKRAAKFDDAELWSVTDTKPANAKAPRVEADDDFEAPF